MVYKSQLNDLSTVAKRIHTPHTPANYFPLKRSYYKELKNRIIFSINIQYVK